MNEPTARAMSKKAATDLARRALQYGHFRDGADAWIDCPRCKAHRVELYADAGRLTHGAMVRQAAQAALDCEYNERHPMGATS